MCHRKQHMYMFYRYLTIFCLDNQVYFDQSYSMGENTNHPTTKQQAHIHESHIVTQRAQDYEMQGSTEAAQDYEMTNGDNITYSATVTTGENYAAYSYATHEVYCLYILCHVKCVITVPLSMPTGGVPLPRWSTGLLLQHNAQGMYIYTFTNCTCPCMHHFED